MLTALLVLIVVWLAGVTWAVWRLMARSSPPTPAAASLPMRAQRVARRYANLRAALAQLQSPDREIRTAAARAILKERRERRG